MPRFSSASHKVRLRRFLGIIANARLAAAIISGLLVISVYAALPVNSPINLAHSDDFNKAGLNAQWAKGDLIVLVRHVERCDHSTAPCLSSTDGITIRAKKVAHELGKEFINLGLDKTDVISSPLTRTVQTSTFMFNQVNATQDWVFHCKGTMLRDVLEHKKKQRNLILVTHSECIEQLEESLNIHSSKTPNYGSSLFVSVDEISGTPQVLGYIDAQDWRLIN